MKKDIIEQFLKLLDELKEDYFIFASIPEKGLDIVKAKGDGADLDNNPIFIWANKFIDNDGAYVPIKTFIISVIASLMEQDRFDIIDEIKEIVGWAYEEKIEN